MAKIRSQKDAILDNYIEKVKNAKAFYIISPTSITPNEANKLRKELEKTDSKYSQVKNTLFKLALTKAGKEIKDVDFSNENAVIFTQGEPTDSAKIVYDFLKEIKKGEIKSGMLDQTQLSSAEVEELAKLPSREIMLGITLSTMNAPVTNFVRVLNGNITNFISIIKQLSEK